MSNHPQASQPARDGTGQPVRKGEYSRLGEFHRNLDPNWSYYPIYINKVELIDELLHRFGCMATPGRRSLARNGEE